MTMTIVLIMLVKLKQPKGTRIAKVVFHQKVPAQLQTHVSNFACRSPFVDLVRKGMQPFDCPFNHSHLAEEFGLTTLPKTDDDSPTTPREL